MSARGAGPVRTNREDGSASVERSSNRDAILDAALRCFLAQGFGQTSMEAVAREAGVARRTVFNQFAGKEVLFTAAVERVWRAFPVVDITRDEAALADPELGLTRIGQAVADFWAPPVAVALLRMVIAEGSRFPDLARSFVEAGKAPAMRAVIGYLEELSRRGTLTGVDDPQLAAKQFLGLINEPLLWLRVIGADTDAASPEERRRVVAQAVATFLCRHH